LEIRKAVADIKNPRGESSAGHFDRCGQDTAGSRDERTAGTPRPWTFKARSRQVSWLAGHRLLPAFPAPKHQWRYAAAARCIQLRGQRRPLTGFPLSFQAGIDSEAP